MILDTRDPNLKFSRREGKKRKKKKESKKRREYVLGRLALKKNIESTL